MVFGFAIVMGILEANGVNVSLSCWIVWGIWFVVKALFELVHFTDTHGGKR